MWRIYGRGFDPRRLHQLKASSSDEAFFFYGDIVYLY
jgi:hypothetical protein